MQAIEKSVDYSETLNGKIGGLNKLIGMRFVLATTDEVVGEIDVRPDLMQPYGLIHGGLYCTLIETLCSTGAALNALPLGLATVGVENSTSFIRAVRSGTIRGVALPLTRGRRTQVWQVEIRDDAKKLVASGRVRMLNIEEGSKVGDAAVGLELPT